MQATLYFDPTQYSERTLQLILAKAEQWKCTPAEAVVRLLDDLAAKQRPRPHAA